MTTAMDIIKGGRSASRRANVEMVDNGFVIDLISSLPEFETIRLVEKSRRKMLAVLKAFFMAKESADEPDDIDEPEEEDEPRDAIEDMEEAAMKRGAALLSDEEADEMI